jgi:hypothetical protein
VYVASFKQLAIFGLRSPGRQKRVREPRKILVQAAASQPKPDGARFWGTVQSVDGNQVTLMLRTGQVLKVDLSGAAKDGTTLIPIVGHNVAVSGSINGKGVLEARGMQRVKGPATWEPDTAPP